MQCVDHAHTHDCILCAIAYFIRQLLHILSRSLFHEFNGFKRLACTLIHLLTFVYPIEHLCASFFSSEMLSNERKRMKNNQDQKREYFNGNVCVYECSPCIKMYMANNNLYATIFLHFSLESNNFFMVCTSFWRVVFVFDA